MLWFKFILGLWAVLNQGSVPDYSMNVRQLKRELKSLIILIFFKL